MYEERPTAPPVLGERSSVLVIVLAVVLGAAALLAHGPLAWVEAGLAAGLLVLLAASHAARRHSRAVLLYRPLRRRYHHERHRDERRSGSAGLR